MHGYAWPEHDVLQAYRAFAEQKMLDSALLLCKNLDAAVVAGACLGVLSDTLAQKFKVVYAFEPEADNFRYLSLNSPSNVVKVQASLTAAPGCVGLVGDKHDAGSWQTNFSGPIPGVRLDSFGLLCNFLYVDVNGMEMQVIEGALKTLNAHKPVVMFAKSERLSDYGATLNFIVRKLEEAGYAKKDEDSQYMVLACE